MCFKTPPQQQDPYVNSPSHKAFTRAFLSKSTVAFGQDDYLACPLGVLFMLSILLGTGGTQGNTSYQIGKSIRLKSMFSPTNQTEAREEIKSLYKELVESLTTEIRTENRKTNQVIKISTGTFVHETVEINPKFQQSLKDDFQEELERVDFGNRTSAAININHWVDEHSYGLVKKFFTSAREIPKDSWMIMISVFYFKDYWENPFEPHYTRIETFSVSPRRNLKVPMMASEEVLLYEKFQKDGFEMISKPFRNTRFTFVVILPLNKWELSKPVEVLNGNKILSKYVGKLKETTVSLRMPKFKLEKTIDLVKPLEDIGIVDLFRPLQADITGISPNKTLHINSFLQSNTLKVDESGVEAAAVTSPILVPVSFIRSEIDFHVTQPFVCFIYDQQLAMPLMAAQIIEPII
uniref:Serpin domain-containing protein n=2 Tax=Trichobilharzia regenti TaxID=157069 RepID=A0AA85KR80_TRIRE|nr:unnamed protein product [Trichobilharzia regenti]